ncbi:hypothetical protein ATANTOWER_003257 [Ataeniobius toweri]|uniref:Uncharacterized protein n=1 Tax=Ataeniobius toweri TaxID=208326 RepID=A0ABU7CET7_9TELE|nr:hypothetical protein [Ataeniobius toweri]
MALPIDQIIEVDERVNRAVKIAEEPGSDWETHDVGICKSCVSFLEIQMMTLWKKIIKGREPRVDPNPHHNH